VSAWTNAPDDPGRVLILSLFGINIVLHMLWSPLFFALKRPDRALTEVLFLWLSIAALILGVGRYSTLAVCLLLPYLFWVTFAALLNLKIVRLNRQANVPEPEIQLPDKQYFVQKGAVVAVSIDGKHRFSKTRPSIILTAGYVVEGDALRTLRAAPILGAPQSQGT
jgi:hypothetical protein